MSKDQDMYDKAAIQQIVKSGHNVIDRVMVVLVPALVEKNPPPTRKEMEGARELVRQLLRDMHANGEIEYPECRHGRDSSSCTICEDYWNKWTYEVTSEVDDAGTSGGPLHRLKGSDF